MLIGPGENSSHPSGSIIAMPRPILLAVSLLALAALAPSAHAQATSLALWYTTNATLVTGPTSPNYTETAINAAGSTYFYAGITPASGNDNAWTNWSTSGSPDAGKYLEYRLAVKSGYRVTLQSLDFGVASTSGNLSLTARASTDGYTANLATLEVPSAQPNTTWSIPLGNLTFTGGNTPYIVRVYGVAPSTSTRLANKTSGILAAEFLGTLLSAPTPTLSVPKKPVTARGPSYLLKGLATNTTSIQWSLNRGKKIKTLRVNGRNWQLRVAPLRPGKNTLSLTALNTATGQKSKPFKVTILY